MTTQLESTARAMVARGRGILAADESTGTIGKRFDSISVENTEENRRAYREMLFTTKGLGQYISGVILYDETLRQKCADGTSFVDAMNRQNILPGIKVDSGAKDMPLCAGELITEGLDGLAKRCTDYAKIGARFAKWRAVIIIGKDLPSAACIEGNAHALARYAAHCQAAGIVPIVEPEVLMDGAHDIDSCEWVTETTLRTVFLALASQRVVLEGIVLKPSMVIAGKECKQQASHREVAERTLKVLRRTVPASVPGIAFLSGGQSDADATIHLNEMNRIGGCPWTLTFSYGRGLQQSAIKVWRGSQSSVPQAQATLLHRAHMNSLAATGDYQASVEKMAA
ncbi:MAG: fructose-bisphosphate aldolase class I [Betaproteobacteria bacterium]|nr:fructose-bisphosphate aldolase class I [Betaproteobacteria bacterium]